MIDLVFQLDEAAKRGLDPFPDKVKYSLEYLSAREIERLRSVLHEIQEEVGHSLPSDNNPTIAEGLSHTIYLMTARGLIKE